MHGSTDVGWLVFEGRLVSVGLWVCMFAAWWWRLHYPPQSHTPNPAHHQTGGGSGQDEQGVLVDDVFVDGTRVAGFYDWGKFSSITDAVRGRPAPPETRLLPRICVSARMTRTLNTHIQPVTSDK